MYKDYFLEQPPPVYSDVCTNATIPDSMPSQKLGKLNILLHNTFIYLLPCHSQK